MEKAIIVGLRLSRTKKAEFENSLDELVRLAETAGAFIVYRLFQHRDRIDSAYLVGRGKAEEIREVVESKGIHTVIFDNDLKAVQQKNLEETIGAKIIDRTRLILDIFARRARSREGMLQVERAQLEYFLPRLSKKGIMLDSQTGGIGTRGPGERKLEVDQRVIRDRIANVDRQIEKVRERRSVLRQKRLDSGHALVALVGYTNSGKSTLLNTLSKGSDVYADDKLFATLDPTTRRVRLPGGRDVLFTDTVGFIRKLPHTLIAAFAATLEEVQKANCLVHVVDVSRPDFKEQMQTVRNVLEELGAPDIPVVDAYNKCDLLFSAEKRRHKKSSAHLISAKTGEGIERLLSRVEELVTPRLFRHHLNLPYEKMNLVSNIFDLGVIKSQQYGEKAVRLRLEASADNWKKILNLTGKRTPP